MTSGFHLSAKDLQVSGNDCQAVRLLSVCTAALLKHHFPNDPAKQALAKAIDIIEKFFKIMTSRVILDKSDDMKCAFRIHLEKQRGILLQFKDWLKSTIFSANDFQVGFIISINGIIDLHHLLKTDYNLPYLKCSHVDQDYVESCFGQIRDDSRGGRRGPSALGLGYR